VTVSASPPAAPAGGLSLRHFLLALAVMAVWGTNFVIIKVGLASLPPLLFATLRFTFAFLPAALFIKRPAVPWKMLAAYGLLIGVGQFGVLFIAMTHFISPGLASLVIQIQVFFTIGLALVISRETMKAYQVAALVLCALGLGVIIARTDASATPLGVGLTLLAALCWAGGNLVTRASGKVDMLGFVVWASLFSIPPLFVLSLLIEGWPAITHAVTHAGIGAWAAVIWQAVGNTLFGYAAWGWLLARNPAATITPTALLVPVFGMGASLLVLGEPLPLWKLMAAGLVLAGLVVNIGWPAIRVRFAKRG
jgi:O-acetylserine/cysteine efflux transporter